MRVVLPVALVVSALIVWAIVWINSRSDQRYKDRTAMIGDENYLDLERSVNLYRRMLEQDDMLPSLLAKHRKEAELIISSFEERQMRKGK